MVFRVGNWLIGSYFTQTSPHKHQSQISQNNFYIPPQIILLWQITIVITMSLNFFSSAIHQFCHQIFFLSVFFMFFLGDCVIALVKKKFGTCVLRKELRQPHGICYLHFGNGVCNGRHNGVDYHNGACTKHVCLLLCCKQSWQGRPYVWLCGVPAVRQI